MLRKRSQRAKSKYQRHEHCKTVEAVFSPEVPNQPRHKSASYLPIVFLLILSGLAYSAWFTDVFVFNKEKNAVAKNTTKTGKSKKSELPSDFDLPPQNAPIDRGYNASSGQFPPGALPQGFNLPGVTSYNPTMQPRAMMPEYGADDGIRQKFTGQIRDTETNLDYYGARYYNSQHGRFTSVDPENAGADPSDPQSWNGYAYARNNPLKYSDPDGREYVICEPGGGNCRTYTDAQVVKLKNDAGVGNFVGSFNEKTGLYSGNIVGADDQIFGSVQQTSIDSDMRRMGLGAAPTLNIWQPVIETLGMIELGLFGGPVTAGAAPMAAPIFGAVAKETGAVVAPVLVRVSLGNLKHIGKHLKEFREIDPSITLEKVVEIGQKIVSKGANASSRLSNATFQETVTIGGRQVLVKDVLNSEGGIRSIYPVGP